MLTLFSIPEPFDGAIKVSRLNAINSWRRLTPKCEIILFGGGPGISPWLRHTGIVHVSDVPRSGHGTPLLAEVFNKAREFATGQVMMFSNCDMLYFDDLYQALSLVQLDRFMLCGRRWDYDLPEEIPFDDSDRWEKVRAVRGSEGRMHGPAGLDFFIFPRSMEFDMPPFVVGRPGWDSWLLWKMRDSGIPVIDGTAVITAIHQNHNYNHLRYGARQYRGSEMQENIRLAGGYGNMMTLREADWVLSKNGLERPAWPRRCLSVVARSRAYQGALGIKRRIGAKLEGWRPPSGGAAVRSLSKN